MSDIRNELEADADFAVASRIVRLAADYLAASRDRSNHVSSVQDQRALAAVLARHPQVRRVTAGHLHRTIAAELAGRAVLAVPSTYVQAKLDLRAQDLEFGDDPAGFAVHTFLDGQLNSHIQPVASRAGG